MNYNLHKCGHPECRDFLQKWALWCSVRQGTELAMLHITSPYHYQWEVLTSKERNMIRKAQKHYEFKPLVYNEHLEDIFEINTSSDARQGQPMTESYTEPPAEIKQPYRLCGYYHDYRWFGAFNRDGVCRGYIAIAIVGDLGIVNTTLGHWADRSLGVMNGLYNYVHTYVGDNYPVVCAINYLDLKSCLKGLADFKRSIGFRPEVCNFDF